MTDKSEQVHMGEAYLIKRGEEVIGYVTDRALAEHIDGAEILVDDIMYEYQDYDIERVPNDDIV